MGIPYAEVIGDPVAHSKSPLIHKFWLEKLGLEGDYRAERVQPDQLKAHLDRRRADPFWRGSNVTAPLKVRAAALVSDPTGLSARIGAMNAIFRSPLGRSLGANTDMIGIAAALGDAAAPGQRACVIGAGGAARAALEYLRLRETSDVHLIVRDAAKGRIVHRAFATAGAVHALDDCGAAIAGAHWLINASPLGMAGRASMPGPIIDALDRMDDYGTVFDMVYAPVETALLGRANALGRKSVDGIDMLIGQAAPAFELFFGAPAPREHDAELRAVLTS
ncbi:MAG TPA: shikimate dehydrogenase [Allosphingosinicella sp.]|jgi:shikimate dehydrogenase|nr:shikimate dehydrogenase [Allosphingosinicella sp.]